MMRLAIGMSASVSVRVCGVVCGVLGVAIRVHLILCSTKTFYSPRSARRTRRIRKFITFHFSCFVLFMSFVVVYFFCNARFRQSKLVVHRVADDRAGHAVTAATSAAQLSADDGDDLNTLLAQ